MRRLKLAWGVHPHLIGRSSDADEMIVQADAVLQQMGAASPGDIVVVILGAPVAQHGSTNLMKLHRIGEADIH